MDRSRDQKAGARKRILLMVESIAKDGPWCQVQYVKAVEVRGVTTVVDGSGETAIKICVLTDRDEAMSYVHKGYGAKYLNVPRGRMKIERLKGTVPITVTAVCGP